MDALLHPKSPELRKAYDDFREQRRKEGKIVLLSVMEERAQERGKKMGEKIGEKIGEAKKALAVASEMLDAGESAEKILRYSKISREELGKLVAARRN